MIAESRIAELMKSEVEHFIDQHPESQAVANQSHSSLLAGVPMPWMKRWAGPFPVVADRAEGGRIFDIDGNKYVDFCLGDTGSMTGHANAPISQAISLQAQRGFTTMLPSSDISWVANHLAERFRMSKWQFCLSATDANRFSLRIARALSGKPKIVVNDWCYHGTVDETLVILDEEGQTVSRPGAIGPQVDPGATTLAVPFNDLDAMERALATGEVACVLMEPALTNIGIVLPQPGYLEGVRRLTKQYGVILILDETHTICAGPQGASRLWGIDADMLVIGKTIGGGIPVAAYGMSSEVAVKVEALMHGHDLDVSGIGGTLSGSALAGAAIRATLTHALRQEDFDIAIPLATRWSTGVQAIIDQHGLPWTVQQLGCRAEYWFSEHPQNGAQAAASVNDGLESFMHLYALNRGILLTPFHNMALMTPFHSEDDVDLHTSVFSDCVRELVS
jgi:glutamate-1-semialdehyde 2,1-aminomutase